MTGGNYNGAENIGTIEYKSGTNPYIFSDLAVRGSSVQIQGGKSYLTLAEVEIYETAGSLILIFPLLVASTYGNLHIYRLFVMVLFQVYRQCLQESHL